MTNYFYEGELTILDRSTCTVKAIFTDFLQVASEWKLNDFGLLQFAVNQDHRVASLLELGDIITWRWRNKQFGIDWVKDWTGLFYDSECQVTGYTSDNPIKQFVGTFAEPNSILADTRVSWLAGVNERSTFTNLPAETIMKLLVGYNLGSNATEANGRLLDNTDWNVTVAADLGRGNIVARYSCAHKNLLDVLQDLAIIGEIDFALEFDDDCQLVFEIYPNQYGTNRTSGVGSIVFSTANRNINDPKYTAKVRGTYNAAIVLGQGEGLARAYTYVLHPTNYNSSFHREMIVDARNEPDAAQLGTIGLIKLLEQSEISLLDYTVVQLPTMHYAKRYFKGDLVTIQICGVGLTQKITNVVTAFTTSGMVFDIGTNNRSTATRDDILLNKIDRLEKQVDALRSGNAEGL